MDGGRRRRVPCVRLAAALDYFVLLGVAGLVLAGLVAAAWLEHELSSGASESATRARSRERSCREDLRRRAEWLAFSRIFELRASADPLVLRGSLEGADILAHADGSGGPRCFLELRARLDLPLGLGLQIRERRAIDRVRRGGLRTGHLEFDEHFVLRSRRPDEARCLLDGEVLDGLVDLRDQGLAVSLSDRLLIVRSSSASADVATFPAIARRCRGLADRIVLRSVHVAAPSVGPYR